MVAAELNNCCDDVKIILENVLKYSMPRQEPSDEQIISGKVTFHVKGFICSDINLHFLPVNGY